MERPAFEVAVLGAALCLVPLFVALASYGVHRGWRRPTTAAFLLVCLAVAVVSLLTTLSSREPGSYAHTVPPGVRYSIVNIVAAAAFLSVPAALFRGLWRASLLARSIAACLGGVVGLALAVGVGFPLACMADLGCL